MVSNSRSDLSGPFAGSGASRSVRMVEVVFPNTTNHYGTMFGGKVVDLMDRAAFIVASKFSNQNMVTASVEHIDFYAPIKSGSLVELNADVVYTGRTSVTVKVDLFVERPVSKTRAHASSGYFTMVSVDESGRPMRVPSLNPESEEQKKEWAVAKGLVAARAERKQVRDEK